MLLHRKRFLLPAVLLLGLIIAARAGAQPALDGQATTRFLSYQRIPTWSAVISDWRSDQPELHLYDSDEFSGHAEFVSRGLQTGLTFAQFRQQVRDPSTRRYLPLFLFDLRDSPIQADGGTYRWAARIEDYGYTDAAADMATTVARLNQLLVQALNLDETGESGVLVVLSRDSNAQPNFEIEGLLAAEGIRGISLPDLLNAVGSPAIEILNPVTAVGELRYVSREDMESARFRPTDIVIFEELPRRVPPVSGIITLAPQTPLSHVNLLARNRGTLNLYARSVDDLPGAADRLGQLVRISIELNRLSISAVTTTEAEAHWASHKPPAVSIPAPDFSIDGIVDLDATGDAIGTGAIGAKAANYALLQQQLPDYVRPGHALPVSWYFEITADETFQRLQVELLTQKQALTADQLDAKLAEIRSRLRALRFDPARMQMLRELVQTHYPDTRIRLRSSTNCEDLAEFNGAGLYESKGYNTFEDDTELFADILEVYASLWTAHAFAEREFYGIDHRRAGMAILVHQAFSDEAANGVVLTIPDAAGFSMLVNSQPGDRAVTNPESGEIPESLFFASSPDSAYEVRSASSIGPVFTGPERQPVLMELKSVSARIHEMLLARLPEPQRRSFGADIEFKLMPSADGVVLFVKQARLAGAVLPD